MFGEEPGCSKVTVVGGDVQWGVLVDILSSEHLLEKVSGLLLEVPDGTVVVSWTEQMLEL